jgi:hypothetical protein
VSVEAQIEGMGPRLCPDCGVEPGQPHEDGCDVEHCTACKGQRLQCHCPGHDKEVARWTGVWPGRTEAELNGWFTTWTRLGWMRCEANTKGARPDLNRLAVFEQTGRDVPTEDYHETVEEIFQEAVNLVLERYPKPGEMVVIDGMELGLDSRQMAIHAAMIAIERVIGRDSGIDWNRLHCGALEIIALRLANRTLWSPTATIEDVIIDDASFEEMGRGAVSQEVRSQISLAELRAAWEYLRSMVASRQTVHADGSSD